MSNFSRIRAENQFVFLNTSLVYGINSIDISENFGNDAIKYIGIGYKPTNQSVNQAQYVDVNINSLLIQEDVFIQQSGLVPINCFILPNLQQIPRSICINFWIFNSLFRKVYSKSTSSIKFIV